MKERKTAGSPAEVPAQQAPADAPSAALVTALQRAAGNAAVVRMLARHDDGSAVAEAEATAPAKTGSPMIDWSTRAKAEETATATVQRLQNELLPYMQNHRSEIVRNTAELFTGAKPLVTLSAMTKRSDSAAQVTKAGVPGWVDPKLHDAFFWGTTMDNVHYQQKRSVGTMSRSTMYLRGHNAEGKQLTLERMANDVVHEVSHFLVKTYGEHADTETDASSFDRYRDEFRAYWIEPTGPFSKVKGKEKAAAIRKHLVGTKDDPTSGYPSLRTPYWTDAGFRAQVDVLEAPEGFNLTNSLRLHRLWQWIQAYKNGRATIEDVIFVIDVLPVDERKEAAESTLLGSFVVSLPSLEARRVRKALDAPFVQEYHDKLNPTKSPKIREFFKAIVRGKPDGMKTAYDALAAGDRKALQANWAFLIYADRHLLDSGLLACVYAMTSTCSVKQFDAMAAFLEALKKAQTEADAGGLTDVPSYVTEAMAGLHDYARWTFFSWSDEAMFDYVELLPTAIRVKVKEALRR